MNQIIDFEKIKKENETPDFSGAISFVESEVKKLGFFHETFTLKENDQEALSDDNPLKSFRVARLSELQELCEKINTNKGEAFSGFLDEDGQEGFALKVVKKSDRKAGEGESFKKAA